MSFFPDVVEFSEDGDCSISRDDLLTVLHKRIDEPDVLYWGMQCNRAIRIVFPSVIIKRKGKFKTYPFIKIVLFWRIHQDMVLCCCNNIFDTVKQVKNFIGQNWTKLVKLVINATCLPFSSYSCWFLDVFSIYALHWYPISVY